MDIELEGPDLEEWAQHLVMHTIVHVEITIMNQYKTTQYKALGTIKENYGERFRLTV